MGKIVLLIIASINPLEREAAETYIKQVTAMQEEVGAKALYRHPVTEVFIGEMDVEVAAAIEFPSQEAFDKVFESKAYKQLIPLRDRGFKTLEAFISKQ